MPISETTKASKLKLKLQKITILLIISNLLVFLSYYLSIESTSEAYYYLFNMFCVFSIILLIFHSKFEYKYIISLGHKYPALKRIKRYLICLLPLTELYFQYLLLFSKCEFKKVVVKKKIINFTFAYFILSLLFSFLIHRPVANRLKMLVNKDSSFLSKIITSIQLNSSASIRTVLQASKEAYELFDLKVDLKKENCHLLINPKYYTSFIDSELTTFLFKSNTSAILETAIHAKFVSTCMTKTKKGKGKKEDIKDKFFTVIQLSRVSLTLLEENKKYSNLEVFYPFINISQFVESILLIHVLDEVDRKFYDTAPKKLLELIEESLSKLEESQLKLDQIKNDLIYLKEKIKKFKAPLRETSILRLFI